METLRDSARPTCGSRTTTVPPATQLKQFFLSDLIHHDLEANEVAQINNIFNDSAIPSTTTTLMIKVEAQQADLYVTGYIVQLDNTTQDGSFFYLFEE